MQINVSLISGDRRIRSGRMVWQQTVLLREDTKYEDMPWEKEAYRLEDKLYDEYKEYLNE